MPQLDDAQSLPRLRRRASQGSEGSLGIMPSITRAEAISSSLDGIHIPPRTPRTASGQDEDDVEVSLLNGRWVYMHAIVARSGVIGA